MSAKHTLATVQTHNQYRSSGLTEKDLLSNPLELFSQWFEHAQSLPEPEAFSLSTVSDKGIPSTRVVLLKQVDERGFVFYTNYESRKGRELFPSSSDTHGGYASMAFYWPPQHRSVRVVGRAEKLTPDETAQYYHSRPVGSQVGAWASKQSSVIKSRDELDERVKEIEQRFRVGAKDQSSANAEPASVAAGADKVEPKGIDDKLPVPPFWGGVRIVPFEVEFWMGRESRLHDRFRFTRPESSESSDAWQVDRLSP